MESLRELVGQIDLLAAVLLFGLLATAAAAQDGTPIPDLIDRLADASRANETVEALVARGREAVPHLVGEAVEGSNLPLRGWAIVCLAGIGGEDVDRRLAEIHADARQPALVRTWAAAGRIELAGTIEELRALGPLVRELPALQRPHGMKAVGLAIGGQGSPEDLLALVASDRQLQQALAQPVLGLGPEKLAGVLVGPGGDEVRRLAAAYLATMGQEGRSEEVASAVLDAYRFDPDASEVPWKGGALWIPSIQWEREPARALARRLLSWFVWGEEHALRGEGQQIHNNLRSLQLAAAAGYQSPGWQEVGLDAWLLVWGRAYGRAELEALLTEQGVADQGRYRRVLDQVGR